MLPTEIRYSKRSSAPPVPAALRLRAREVIAQYVERGNAEQGSKLRMPTCSFDLTGTTAGLADFRRNHVRLNAVLLMENTQLFITDTIPHEVAHLVCRNLHGAEVASHGPEWQRVMRRFGIAPKRTHAMDTKNAVTSVVYEFKCACVKPHEIKEARAKRYKRSNLHCTDCNILVKPTGRIWQDGRWVQAFTVPPFVAEPFKSTRSSTPRRTRVPRTPVPSPRPQPRTPLAPPSRYPGYPPSPAMLKFAQDLAKKLGIAVPPRALTEKQFCSEFITATKAAVDALRGPRPSVPPAPAATPGTPPIPNDAPTEKQLAFAHSIARRKALTIPETALNNRRNLSTWIDANK